MLVNLRGTSGSGKSTLVRKIMALYPERKPITVDWRKQPLGYFCYAADHRTLFVPGHYETDCGGTDTLLSIDMTYSLIRKYMDECDVIYEGLITQSDVTRCVQLHKDGHQLKVLALSTPIDVCLSSVQARRDAKAAARGKEPIPLNSKNTIAKFNQLRPQERRFRDAGVDFRWVTREEALSVTMEALEIE